MTREYLNPAGTLHGGQQAGFYDIGTSWLLFLVKKPVGVLAAVLGLWWWFAADDVWAGFLDECGHVEEFDRHVSPAGDAGGVGVDGV